MMTIKHISYSGTRRMPAPIVRTEYQDGAVEFRCRDHVEIYECHRSQSIPEEFRNMGWSRLEN